MTTTAHISIYGCSFSLCNALIMEKSNNSDFDPSDSVTAPRSLATTTPRAILRYTRHRLRLSKCNMAGTWNKYMCVCLLVLIGWCWVSANAKFQLRNNDTSATEDSEKDIAKIILHSTFREVCTCFDNLRMHTIFFISFFLLIISCSVMVAKISWPNIWQQCRKHSPLRQSLNRFHNGWKQWQWCWQWFSRPAHLNTTSKPYMLQNICYDVLYFTAGRKQHGKVH